MKRKGKFYQLCTFFGILLFYLSVWLDFALLVLLEAITGPQAENFYARWPSVEEKNPCVALLENNRKLGPLLKGMFGTTDGGRFKCQNYANFCLKNAYGEGYTQQEEVTNLFVVNFYGEIIHAAINYPGSWHDTQLAGISVIYNQKLFDATPPAGMAILRDSAFVNNNRFTNSKTVRARKTNETSDIPGFEELAAIDLIIQRVMLSKRQSAEWGIRVLKGQF